MHLDRAALIAQKLSDKINISIPEARFSLSYSKPRSYKTDLIN